jgi:hypothetical protein
VAALAVGPGQMVATLAFAAQRADGKVQVELARHEPGTDWVVIACHNAWTETGRPIVVDPKAPTVGVIPLLVKAGIEVREVSTSEYVEACTGFQNDVINDRVVHLNDADLADALRAASPRPIGETFVYSSKASEGDITPLIAVTLATWGASKPMPVDLLSQVF